MKRILILEDDEQFRKFLADILADEGYQVDAVSDGTQGLTAVADNRFDLIITDMFMPETDGMQFLREIRNKHRSMKVIGMSGGGRGVFPSEVLPAFEILGAQKTIDKPFTKKELLPLVHELLEE